MAGFNFGGLFSGVPVDSNGVPLTASNYGTMYWIQSTNCYGAGAGWTNITATGGSVTSNYYSSTLTVPTGKKWVVMCASFMSNTLITAYFGQYDGGGNSNYIMFTLAAGGADVFLLNGAFALPAGYNFSNYHSAASSGTCVIAFYETDA